MFYKRNYIDAIYKNAPFIHFVILYKTYHSIDIIVLYDVDYQDD